ncbi:hypothetical protein KKE60_08130 [Patescibacteria group bacterium]|nr:hypothetical protein [Patescibacteria group bacterium]
MSDTIYFNVLVDTTIPTDLAIGWYYFNPNNGSLFRCYGVNKKASLGWGIPYALATGVYSRTVTVSETPPAEEYFNIWQKPSTGQVYMFLGYWIIIAGGRV